jgi:glucose/mannose transport system substrate-binding protein
MFKKLVSAMLVLGIVGVLFGFAPIAAADGHDQLITYHWWTAGGEKEAIDAVFALFNIVYPNVELVENPTSGGGGGIMRAQIKNMILAGNAPDTFQLTYGSGMLASFVDALEPIDDIWGDLPVPAKIKEMGTIDGHQYGIPLNIMRNNCLWYNKKLVEEIGIDMPLATLDDFFAACEKVKNAGYAPYAIGAGAGQEFWLAHIFEQFVLAVPDGGPAYLEKLYAGEADPANDPAVRQVLEALKRLMNSGYVNSDYGALTWDQAGDLLVAEKAVFVQMGDWMKGHFTSLGWESGVDFSYQPSPGSEGMFTLHLDCFVLPKGAPHETAAKKWLSLLTTKEAETAFCPIKGATPPRLDAFTDMYDVISQDILAAFRDPNTSIVESAWAAPPEAWLGAYGSMLSGFLENPDVDRGVRDFADTYIIVFE